MERIFTRLNSDGIQGKTVLCVLAVVNVGVVEDENARAGITSALRKQNNQNNTSTLNRCISRGSCKYLMRPDCVSGGATCWIL